MCTGCGTPYVPQYNILASCGTARGLCTLELYQMNKQFLELIDLSVNIKRAIATVRNVDQGTAGVLIFGLTILTCGVGCLVWYFDIQSTMAYTSKVADKIAPTLPPVIKHLEVWAVVMLTALPPVAKLVLPRIGASVKAVAYFVYLIGVADAFTDWPHVCDTIALYTDSFNSLGWVGWLAWWPAHGILLLFSTFLFEMIFWVCVVTIGYLLLKLYRERPRKGPQIIEEGA